MAHILYDDYLLMRVREACFAPSPGVRPWKARELVRIIERVAQAAVDHRSFYVDFMEGIRDLAEDPDEDRILREFAQHALAAEPRIHADDPDVRDHLTHVTQVFLFGWLILNSSRAFSETTAGKHAYGWTQDNYFDRLNRAWLYSALLHDCAYSVEYAKHGELYEQLVKERFGNQYEAGKPGTPRSETIAAKGRLLWRERGKWLKQELDDEQLATLFGKQYERPDHAIVGGVAIWEEAVRLNSKQNLSEILKAAAVAIACHNFQYLVTTEVPANHTHNSWLQLDMDCEPLGFLLHLCDELQEWGREREDESFLYQHSVKPARFARTELTFLDIHHFEDLAMDVRLARHLHPADRLVRHRIRREQELRIADQTKRLGLLFGRFRSASKSPMLRLRVQQTVDDERCSNAVLVNWPISRTTPPFTDVFVPPPSFDPAAPLEDRTAKDSKGNELLGIRGKKGFFSADECSGAKLVLQAAGGAGKSTVLAAVCGEVEQLGWRPLYCEQLPQQPISLSSSIAGDGKQDLPTLVVIDHLDRVVDEESFSFWLNELKNMPSAGQMCVVVACRPEEFDRYFRHILSDKSGWKHCSLDPADSLLLPGPDKSQDERHRLLVSACEAALKGSSVDVFTVARWAAEMGNRRLIPFPAAWDFKLSDWTFQTRLGRKPILQRDRNSHLRFLHDCIQDFFSALHLVNLLAQLEPSMENKADIVQTVLLLEGLPRDVPRLLFGLLANTNGKLVTGEMGRRAARALARGLMWDRSIQQWLYDSARLQQARYSLAEFLATYSDDSEIALVAAKLVGHAEYEKFASSKPKTLQHAEESVVKWSDAAKRAEILLEESIEEDIKQACRWVLGFLADHIVVVLTKVSDRDRSTAQKWAKKLSNGPPYAQTSPFAFGWMQSLMRRFASARCERDVDTLMSALDADFEQAEKDYKGTNDLWLHVRRAHLAGHVGNYFLKLRFRGSKPLPDQDRKRRLRKAISFFQKSIYLRERVLRYMEEFPEKARDIEVFATLCQGYSDDAHQYRGVFEALLGLSQYESARGKIRQRYALLAAHRQQERAWAVARHVRGPSERLPNMFVNSFPLLVIGDVVAKALQDVGPRKDQADHAKRIEKALNDTAKRMFNEHSAIAEQHAGASFGPELDHGLKPNQITSIIENLARSR